MRLRVHAMALADEHNTHKHTRIHVYISVDVFMGNI